ncbi:MAG: CPBP family glutamic-type intramembrane protease [Acidobacteriota bacterium]|nr:CPBP family glutamic-type intramembrane protease [Acidobacteriota bacterium]
MSFLFFNAFGRLRSGWRFLLFAFAFMFCVQAIGGVIFLSARDSRAIESFLGGNGGFIIQNIVTLVVSIILAFVFQKKIEDLPAKTLGWTVNGRGVLNFLLGVGVGIATLFLSVLIVFGTGALNFNLNKSGAEAFLQSFLASGLVFGLGAAAEETLFRGYALQTFSRARLAWLGVLITSLPFALGHLGNPNVVPAFTFLNTALAGVWLGIAYLKTRDMWFPFGVHFAWNFVMAQILGIPVSGITSIAPTPFLKSIDSNNLVWLSGGDYGIEGGAACTIALIVSTLFIWFAPFLKADEELLTLTSRENPVKANSQSV